MLKGIEANILTTQSWQPIFKPQSHHIHLMLVYKTITSKMPLYKYCTSVARRNLGTKKTAALCRFNEFNYCLMSTIIYYYH